MQVPGWYANVAYQFLRQATPQPDGQYLIHYKRINRLVSHYVSIHNGEYRWELQEALVRRGYAQHYNNGLLMNPERIFAYLISK